MEAFQDLKEHMESTKNKREYIKARIVYLMQVEKIKAKDVAVAMGTSKQMVHFYNGRYKKFGIAGLINKYRGGRKWSFMSLEEEKQLLESITPDAKKGLVVISKIVRNKAEEYLGHPVSADYAEDLLNRHEWHKVMPRPKHPKSSKEEQEEFKKKLQKL
jgi:transposase